MIFLKKIGAQHMSVFLIGKVEILRECLTSELVLHQFYDDTTHVRSFLQFLRKNIAIKLVNKQLIPV